MSLANLFVKKLQNKGLTLALAESVTCGMAASKLASCMGASEVFNGGVVCYTPEVKRSLLGVSQRAIDRYTCESEEVTQALAINLGKIIKADIFAALTGLAAKGGSETKEKPVGTIFFCVKYKNRVFNSRKLFRGSPMEIRKKACKNLFQMIIKKIEA